MEILGGWVGVDSASVCYVSRCNTGEVTLDPVGSMVSSLHLVNSYDTVPCNTLEGKYPKIVFSPGLCKCRWYLRGSAFFSVRPRPSAYLTYSTPATQDTTRALSEKLRRGLSSNLGFVTMRPWAIYSLRPSVSPFMNGG